PEDSDVDEVLSKLQKILKKKKNGSRRIQKKEKKEKEPVCYECRKPGNLRPDCPKLKKTGQPEKFKKQHKKFKRKAMATAWENDEATTSESSSSDSEKEQEIFLLFSLDLFFPANKKGITYYFWVATGNIEVVDSSSSKDSKERSEDSDDEAMLSRKLQIILAKKKKFGSKDISKRIRRRSQYVTNVIS
ncbi:hypothetical protein Taro_000259, partial [Colocasia esculenta]|nr:hypothetical protein [Colocasia esculenta]